MPTSPCPILDGVTVISSADEVYASTGNRRKKSNNAKSKEVLLLIDIDLNKKFFG
jgi:hypothetical protein